MDVIIKREPDSDDIYDASEEASQEIVPEIKNEMIVDSDNKRKTIEESVDEPNKRQCTRYFRASTSTEQSSSQNDDLSYQEKILEFEKESSSSNILKSHDFCAFQYSEKIYPHHSITLLYQLELSILCLLRKNAFDNISKPIFRNSRTGKCNIRMCLGVENICIRVEHVDTYYLKTTLNFNSFFLGAQGNFTLRYYFNEFAVEILHCLESNSNVPKYLIIYTNSGLDITEDGKLKRDGMHLQLSRVTAESDPELINFLFNNKGDLYRFANDENTRNQLSDVINLTKNVIEQILEKGFTTREIMQTFFDCLILAVNQPTMEELIAIVRSEVSGNEDLIESRKEVMSQLLSDDEGMTLKKFEILLSSVYSFNLFLFYINDMFLNENIHAVKFEENIKSHVVTLNLKNRIVCVKPLEVGDKLVLKEVKMFSIQFSFSSFIQQLENDYFVVYTDASLELINDLMFGNLKNSKENYHLTLEQIDTKQNEYAFLSHLCINENYLYKFSQDDRMRLLNFVNILPEVLRLEKVKEIFFQDEKKQKELFLNKIIFAVRQSNFDDIYNRTEKAIRLASPPYDCDELNIIASRYLKSYKLDVMTKEVMITLCDDIKSKPSFIIQETVQGFEEEIDFAKRLIVAVETPEFNEFVTFLIRGDGKVCLDVLRRNGIKLSDISRILESTGRKQAKYAFVELFYLCFDNQGNKTQLLKSLENSGLSIGNIFDLLSGSKSTGPKILKKFYNIWFDNFGNPTPRFKSMVDVGTNLTQISVLFHDTGCNFLNKLITFTDFWFDKKGRRTQCLKTLQASGINLATVLRILHNFTAPFQHLYNLWFDAKGEKSMHLKTMEKAGINLSQVCGILEGSGKNAPKTFLKFYNLWFDPSGRKSFYLLSLQKEGVNLQDVFNILPKTGLQAADVFKNLHSLWFNQIGEKTQDLKNLEANGWCLSEICKLLKADGSSAVKKFKELCLSPPSFVSPLEQLISNLICKQEIKQETTNEGETVIVNLNCEVKDNTNIKQEVTEEGAGRSDYQTKDSTNIEQEIAEGSGGNGSQAKTATSIKQEVTKEGPGGNDFQTRVIASIKQEVTEDVTGGNDYEAEYNANIKQEVTEESARGKDYHAEASTSKSTENAITIFNEEKESDSDMSSVVFVSDEEESEDTDEGIVNKKLLTDRRGRRDIGNDSSDGKELKRKITTVLNLFPSWKKVKRSKMKKGRIVSDMIHILNDANRLRGFLERKVKMKLIRQDNFEDLYSVIHHAPFTTIEVLDLVEDELGCSWKNDELISLKAKTVYELQRACKTEYNFAKIIFDNKRSEINILLEFLTSGHGKGYLKRMQEMRIETNGMAKVFKGSLSGYQVIEGFRDLCMHYVDGMYPEKYYCNTLSERNVNLLGFIIRSIGSSGIHAAQAFKNLHNLWFDASGQQTHFLTSFPAIGVPYDNILSIFRESGANAFKVYQSFYYLCFDTKGEKTNYVNNLEKEVDLKLFFQILNGAGEKACRIFMELYNLWFDPKGCKSKYLFNLERCGLKLKCVLKLIVGNKVPAPHVFKTLYNYLFDAMGNKQKKINILEKEIKLSTLFRIIRGSKTKAMKTLNDLYSLWFDSKGNKTVYLRLFEESGVNLTCIAGVLNKTGKKASNTFIRFFNYFFNGNGTKTMCLNNIESVIELKAMIEIVSGENQTFPAFQKLYSLWFNPRGHKTPHLRILEENGISLMEVSKMLSHSGNSASNKFLNFCDSVKRGKFSVNE